MANYDWFDPAYRENEYPVERGKTTNTANIESDEAVKEDTLSDWMRGYLQGFSEGVEDERKRITAAVNEVIFLKTDVNKRAENARR